MKSLTKADKYRLMYGGAWKYPEEEVFLFSEEPLNKGVYVFTRKMPTGHRQLFTARVTGDRTLSAAGCGNPHAYIFVMPELPNGGDWE